MAGGALVDVCWEVQMVAGWCDGKSQVCRLQWWQKRVMVCIGGGIDGTYV